MYKMYDIIIAILGSSLLSSVIGLISSRLARKDQKEDHYEELKKGLEEREERGAERFRIHKEKIDGIYTELRKRDEVDEAFRELMIGYSRDRIQFVSKQILKRKAITILEKSTLKSIYVPYEKLGGNSYGKTTYESCMAFPVVSEEEAEKMDKEIRQREFQEMEEQNDSNR
jgi:hypothetical protein